MRWCGELKMIFQQQLLGKHDPSSTGSCQKCGKTGPTKGCATIPTNGMWPMCNTCEGFWVSFKQMQDNFGSRSTYDCPGAIMWHGNLGLLHALELRDSDLLLVQGEHRCTDEPEEFEKLLGR